MSVPLTSEYQLKRPVAALNVLLLAVATSPPVQDAASAGAVDDPIIVALGGSSTAAAFNANLAIGLAVEAKSGGLDGQLFLAAVNEVGQRSSVIAEQMEEIGASVFTSAGDREHLDSLAKAHRQIEVQSNSPPAKRKQQPTQPR